LKEDEPELLQGQLVVLGSVVAGEYFIDFFVCYALAKLLEGSFEVFLGDSAIVVDVKLQKELIQSFFSQHLLHINCGCQKF